ncbi:MAG: FecR family protein [Treponema sp.]|jgi:hypothetical protein|nr:FecR family protein [Treponema sp.]
METTEITKPEKQNKSSLLPEKFGKVDLIVSVSFIFIFILGIILFAKDLLQTINVRNVEPVGIVVVKRNVVQRRLSDRVLWDRLTNESPVFFGDLIRVAEDSAATLYFDGSSIDLDENTLIRITHTSDRGIQILLNEGRLFLAMQEEGKKITLNVDGQQIQPAGDAEIQAGKGLQNTDEDTVRQPVPNARFLNDTQDPLPVGFMWNRGELAAEDLLRLEISSDRNFRRIVHVRNNLSVQTEVPVANGVWYWRLLNKGDVFDEGRFSVIDGAGARLQSPAASSVYRYTDELPVMNFQWDHSNEAINYILEICDSSEFAVPQIRRESEVTFFTSSDLGEGTWYWRVKPVFPAVYKGESSFSQSVNFFIEKTADEQGKNLSLADWFLTEVPPELMPASVAASGTAGQSSQSAALLSAPQNLQPASGRRYTMSDLQAQRTINFSWRAVQGADAYIFTLFHQTDGGRRQILRTQPINYPQYILDDLRILDRGTFIWQVEAITTGAGGLINRRGNIAESSFFMDILLPGSIQVR